MSRLPRIELAIFVACFFAFAYFNQGGGWNQNARFAEVRAIVEQGRFPIDDYLIYKRDPSVPANDTTGQKALPWKSASTPLVRLPLNHAEYEWEGKRRRLSWV